MSKIESYDELVAYLSALGRIGLEADPGAVGGGTGLARKFDQILEAISRLSDLRAKIIVRHRQLQSEVRLERASAKIAMDDALQHDPWVRAAASQRERESRARDRARSRYECLQQCERGLSEAQALLDVVSASAGNLKLAKESVSRQVSLLEMERDAQRR